MGPIRPHKKNKWVRCPWYLGFPVQPKICIEVRQRGGRYRIGAGMVHDADDRAMSQTTDSQLVFGVHADANSIDPN